MDIYQHFRKEEQIFIEQIFDWIQQVNTQYAPYLTNFLNPRQIFIVESVIGQYEEINYQADGGYEEAEQKRILLYPPYYKPMPEDFELVLYEINYPTKFAELSHGQILGSIMATGISRSNLGDILTDGQRWQFFIDQKMASFIKLNLEKVGNINIHLEKQSLNERIENVNEWEAEEIIVSSLRIDVILARALNISRNRAKQLIDEQKIKLNWVQIDRPDLDLEEYDLLSIRGYGRIQIQEQVRVTKKDNLVLKIAKISRNR